MNSFESLSIFRHFQSFVWLRWRIRINQMRHGSTIGKVFAALLLVSYGFAIVIGVSLGVTAGVFLPRMFSKENYFLLWDGWIAIFCVVWVIQVATDLQRSDAITFDRILHLPVPYEQAFAVNYLSSLIGLPFLFLSTLSFGFILGSCFSIGPIAILIAIPFAVFLLAVTALTYQLQGWLATLMSNPKLRPYILIGVPIVIVLCVQLPAMVMSRIAKQEAIRTTTNSSTNSSTVDSNLIAQSNQEKSMAPAEIAAETTTEIATETIADATTETTADATTETTADANPTQKADPERAAAIAVAKREAFVRMLRRINLLAPPLWMAGCVESIMAGSLHVFWLTGAMGLAAGLSLRRNLRQTLRYYKGETDGRSALRNRVAKAAVFKKEPSESAAPVSERRTRVALVERSVAYVSEETSAITAMTWQTMSRAAEVKLYVLLPFVTPFMLYGILKAWSVPPIEELKAGIIVGLASFVLFISSGMLGNAFGYDRAGFRAFVLSPVRRERILLGRNLAIAPILLLQILVLSLAVGIYFHLAFDKLLCAILLSTAMLPPYLLLTNIMSILTPFPLAAGSIQPKQFTLIPVLLSMVLSMFMPLMMLIAVAPLVLEWLIDRAFPRFAAVPIALLFAITLFVGACYLYRWLLPWEGKLLVRREKELLRVVTSKIE